MAVALHRAAVGATGAEPHPDDEDDHDHDEAADDEGGHATAVLVATTTSGMPLFKRRAVGDAA
jgi:hypothetical protein